MTTVTSKHTLGPWQRMALQPDGRYPIRSTSSERFGTIVAEVGNMGGQFDGEGEANADLIAKAPELLAKLESVFDLLLNRADIRGEYIRLYVGENAEGKYDALLQSIGEIIGR